MTDKTTIDELYDSYLNINTLKDDDDDIKQNEEDNIYEVTSYFFLERLFMAFPFKEDDVLADFGCGKGRVLFMASHFSCKNLFGYENNQERFNTLQNNIEAFKKKHGDKSSFNIKLIDVQDVKIDDGINKFFFFEPFSLDIFKRVMANIKDSLKRKQREAAVFLYLPDESTLEYFDSLGFLSREIHSASLLYYQNEELVSVPQFAIYANYSMEKQVNPNLLIY